MKTILCAVDFSPVTSKAVEEAGALAKAFGGSVYLLHVAAPDPDFVGYEAGPQQVRDTVAQHIHEHRDALQQLRDGLAEQGIESHAMLIQGPTAEKIVEEAKRLEAGTIVMGSHGYGAIRHLIVGSVSEAVIKAAPCPVLVVPSALAES